MSARLASQVRAGDVILFQNWPRRDEDHAHEPWLLLGTVAVVEPEYLTAKVPSAIARGAVYPYRVEYEVVVAVYRKLVPPE